MSAIVVRWPIGIVPVFANPSRSVRLRPAPPMVSVFSNPGMSLKLSLTEDFCIQVDWLCEVASLRSFSRPIERSKELAFGQAHLFGRLQISSLV